jgi:serine/threonine protein kinase
MDPNPHVAPAPIRSLKADNRERRLLVEQIFIQVADLPTEARSRYLAEQNIDVATQREVEALIAIDSGVSTSLERDIGLAAEHALKQLEPIDTCCGAYRLRDLLGRGGMGAVFLADRVDGELSQRVAIKLLRPDCDEPSVRQRFLTERQILSSLCHSNIAKLLDAGHRQNGQPYLVMEYVEGEPIDVYTRDFGIRQKISLLLKVCAAVAYLHRNLVVHRDLKPGNILVTAEGEPKLLDFGIAKIVELNTHLTATHMRMLTLDYASPEQVAGGRITTASDIYSLAAVLYKLLTGASPHESTRESASGMTFAICTGRIPPPSRLNPAVKGDLEMILMKALRLEPQDRYSSVEQFANDLESYLHSLPIHARKGDSCYRVRKLVRRHWLPATATVVTLAGLSAGVILSNRERAVAERRFRDVRQLANVFLFDFERSIRDVPGTLDARNLVASTSQRYLKQLASESRYDPTLDREIAESYERLGEIQESIQSAGGKSPGDTDSLLQALQIHRRLGDDHSHSPAYRRKYIELAASLGYRYQDEHNAEEAARWADEAMRLSEKWISAEPQSIDALAAGTAAFMRGATTREVGGQITAAVTSLEKAVTYGERALSLAPGDRAISFLLSEAYVIYCDLLVDLTRYSDALVRARRCLHLIEPLWAGHPHDRRFRIMFLNATSAVGIAERRLGETDPKHLQLALPFLQRAFDLAAEAMHADFRNMQDRANFIVHSNRLCLLLVSLKQFDAAAATCGEAYLAARELVAVDPRSRRNWYLLGKTQLDLGWILIEQHKPAQARLALLRSDEGFSRALRMDPTDSILLEACASRFEGLARAARASDQIQDARHYMLQCLEIMRRMIRRDPSAKAYIGEYPNKLQLARELGVSTLEF